MSELSPEALSLVEGGRSAGQPSAADRERLRSKLVAQLGAAAFASATATHASTATALSSNAAGSTVGGAAASSAATVGASGGTLFGLTKLALAAALVGAACGGVYLSVRAFETVPAAPAAPATAARAPAAALSKPAAPTGSAPVVLQQAPEVVAETPAPVAVRKPRRERPSPVAVSTPAQAPSAPSLDLAAELELLARAQAALRQNRPEQALALAHEHEARFAAGAMSEERRGVEALARCALGDVQHEVVAAFLSAAPSSPMAPRVREACRAK